MTYRPPLLPAPDETQTAMLSTKNYVPPGTAEWGQ